VDDVGPDFADESSQRPYLKGESGARLFETENPDPITRQLFRQCTETADYADDMLETAGIRAMDEVHQPSFQTAHAEHRLHDVQYPDSHWDGVRHRSYLVRAAF
jgi:hypothetical protein